MNKGFILGQIDNPQGSGGRFIGNFFPEGHSNKTEALEVAYKKMDSSSVDLLHVHGIATEVIIILKGRIDFLAEGTNGKLESITLLPRDYLMINPGVKCGIERVFDDTEVIVIKSPSVPDDKRDS